MISRFVFAAEAVGDTAPTFLFVAALALFLSASAGAYRCLVLGAAEIAESCALVPTDSRRTRRFSGILDAVVGYLFAAVLFVAVYAAVFLLLLWEELTALIARHVPANGITALLSVSRYLLPFLLFYALCFGLLRILPPHICAKNTDGFSHSRLRPPTAPGALFCTVGLCAVNAWFALFLRGSAKYALVYGSLASMILFLTWMFVCGNLLLLGIAVNAAMTPIARN